MIPSDPPAAPEATTPTPAPETPPAETPPAAVAEVSAAGQTAGTPPDVLGAAPPPPPAPALPAQPVPAVPPAPQASDLSRIAQDLQIRKAQVEATVQLLDEGNTVPFITRYRKEKTGGLDEEFIRRIEDRVAALRHLTDRKQTILKTIANQGRLSDELVASILEAEHPKRLEDLYLPFKPKKRTLASEARERGLEPLAQAIWNADPAVEKLDEVLPGMVDAWKQLHDTNDVLNGVKHILAEVVSELAGVRGPLRAFFWDTALIAAVKVETVPEAKGLEYRDYFAFKEPVRQIPPHRMLAVNRGEKEQIIRTRMEWDAARVKEIAVGNLRLAEHPHRDFLTTVVEDAVARLVMPSLEREIRRDLTDRAQDRAVHIFAQNLRSLILQPPLRGKRVLAVDPGLRTGCKVAVLDETGGLLEETVIFPHPPQKKAAEAKRKLEQLVRKYQASIIAIGNGTACRETEQIISDLIEELEHRRLHPTPVASAEPPVTSEAVAARPAPEPTAPAAEPSAPAAVFEPVVSNVPELAESLGGSEAMVMPAVVLPDGETGSVNTATPTTTEAVAETVSAPAAAAAPPPAPVISLEGLDPAPADLAYVIVNEAGASDYSASPVAKEEFPNHDATVRGTVSIGRRLQDPLAELVKIDPQHVGVGLYQHDVRPKHLKESLEAVIQSCVNHVGVDLNTASVPLLRHVSGLNVLVARELVEYRKANGPFTTRDDLQKVPNFGEKRYTQAAGFLKINDGPDPLDATWIHPESYATARQMLADLGFTPADLRDKAKLEELRAKLRDTSAEAAAEALKVGVPTVLDIFEALARPGRDPREDLPPPIFKKGILKLEDLTPGMELKGTVLNVVDFGAFVDVGLKDSGLVHISQLANRYIKSPYDVVAVGDVITVWVIAVDSDRRRVSLTMMPAGGERRPPDRRPQQQDRQQQDRPQQDRPQQQDRPMQQQGDRPPPRGGERQGFAPRGDRPPQQGDRQGSDRPPPRPFNRGPMPRGPGGPPAGGRGPGGMSAPVDAGPPKPPAKPKALPKLTAEKKSGKAPLQTFAELAALFKKEEAAPPKPVEAAAPPAESATPVADAPPPAADAPKPE